VQKSDQCLSGAEIIVSFSRFFKNDTIFPERAAKYDRADAKKIVSIFKFKKKRYYFQWQAL